MYVSVCFTLNFTYACKISKRGYVLGGIKIVDREAMFPGYNKILFHFRCGD